MKAKQKVTLAIIIFLAIAFVFTLLLIYPIFNRIVKNSEEMTLATVSLTELDIKIKNLRSFQSFSKKNNQSFEDINKLFLDSDNPLNFIEFLEDQASIFQLLLEINPKDAIDGKEDFFPSMEFNLVLNGGFSNFSAFLEKLELSPYLIFANAINIRGLTDIELRNEKFEGLLKGDVAASLSLKVYTQ